MSKLLATIGVAKADEADATLRIGWNVLAPILDEDREIQRKKRVSQSANSNGCHPLPQSCEMWSRGIRPTFWYAAPLLRPILGV